jgi:hypothetical protein
MSRKSLLILALIAASSFQFVSAQSKTVVNDVAAKKMLIGKHKLSLQWISWKAFGVATVKEKRGVFYLSGEQKKRGGSDFVKIDGVIVEINPNDFVFEGKIITQVNYINGGKPCQREGQMAFKITGKRKYWRLMEMNNPCDEAADYVDIYFR